MILIRGIKEEAFARKIEKGIVDCRDILSALIQPPITGYEYSDFYEKNLVKAFSYLYGTDEVNVKDPILLYNLMTDYFISHTYLTYFHILNTKSIDWLNNNFDEGYSFIAIDVNLDRITKSVIGEEYFGFRMSYIEDIKSIDQNELNLWNVACMCSIEHLFNNKTNMRIPLQIYNSLAFPLLHREIDGRFTDIENEFRIISFDCPSIEGDTITQIPRSVCMTDLYGQVFIGEIYAGNNTILRSKLNVMNNHFVHLDELLKKEHGRVSIDSKFKSIDISIISDDYKYIGNKEDCKRYVEHMLKKNPPDKYVDRTVRKSYRRDEVDAKYAPSHFNVEY